MDQVNYCGLVGTAAATPGKEDFGLPDTAGLWGLLSSRCGKDSTAAEGKPSPSSLAMQQPTSASLASAAFQANSPPPANGPFQGQTTTSLQHHRDTTNGPFQGHHPTHIKVRHALSASPAGDKWCRDVGLDQPEESGHNHTLIDYSLAGYKKNTAPDDIDRLLLTLRSALPPVVTATFSGLPHEDPEKFLTKLQAQLENQRIPVDQWAEFAERQLRGEASIWAKRYQGLQLDWPEFVQRFNHRFNNTLAVASLWSDLYGRKQSASESVEIFLLQKLKLLRRLAPQCELQFLPVIIEQLRPELRIQLRAVPVRNFEDLMNRATLAEKDELEAKSTSRPAKNTPNSCDGSRGDSLDQVGGRPIVEITTKGEDKAAQRRSSLAPWCHYCPERHFHRDCPVKNAEPGNGQGPQRNKSGLGPSTN